MVPILSLQQHLLTRREALLSAFLLPALLATQMAHRLPMPPTLLLHCLLPRPKVLLRVHLSPHPMLLHLLLFHLLLVLVQCHRRSSLDSFAFSHLKDQLNRLEHGPRLQLRLLVRPLRFCSSGRFEDPGKF